MLDLANYEEEAREAIRAFWGNRQAAMEKQVESGKVDAGTRGAVTAGKNLDGFIALVRKLIVANGLVDASVSFKKGTPILPGYFRATKEWDLIITRRDHLVAVIELKSQVGSFSKNFNNRTEEVLGSAHDLWTAFRESTFGDSPRPFTGWMMVVEDCPGSRSPVATTSPHFAVRPEFQDLSYAGRYELLCRRLVQENMYTAACLLMTSSDAVNSGDYSEMSEITGLKNWVSAFAGHVAAEAARSV